LNHDTFLDLIGTVDGLGTGQSGISMRLGNGAGGFNAVSIVAVPDGPFELAVADLNHDTHPDVVTINSGLGSGVFPSGFNNSVSVLLGDGAGGMTNRHDYTQVAQGMSSVSIGDVDQDGEVDVVTSVFHSFSGDAVAVLLGTGEGVLNVDSRNLYRTGTSPLSLALGDLDADGDLELVTANYSFANDTVSILQSAPRATLEILDDLGGVLETGAAEPTNVDRAISQFVAPADGVYFVRSSFATVSSYSLLVTRGAGLQAEPNDSA